MSGLHGPSRRVDPNHKRRIELEANLPGNQLNGFPAKLGVGNCARSTHKCDTPVPQGVQVDQSLFDGLVMIQNNVGHVLSHAVG